MDPRPSTASAADLPDPVVEEGEGWWVLDKPAGLPVFPPHADPEGDSLLGRLLRTRPVQGEPAWPVGFEGGLAHRLDTATSGMVLAATSPEALAWIRSLFEAGALHKRYVFLTRREVAWDRHRLELPLAHDPRRRARMVVQRGPDTPHRGRWLQARTALLRLGQSAPGTPELLRAWRATIQTGVMHQVRLHAAFAGLALAGDRLYGGGEPTLAARQHARSVGLEAPPFHLHHQGLRGEGLHPRPLDLPRWWPPCVLRGKDEERT